MARELREQDAACAIARGAAVVGEWWSLLIVREVTRGRHRFDDLHAELGISRRVLAERLKHLLDHGVLERRPYQQRPTRYEYHLTAAGRALAPVLIGLQDWADRFVLGDGTLTGSASPGAPEIDRLHALVGTGVPGPLLLPAAGGGEQDVVAPDAPATVVFTYPATGIPGPLPANWSEIPGAAGCTLENRLFRASAAAFADAGVALRGVSTQRPEEQRAFAEAEDIPFPLLSDVDLTLCAALRLPTFRSGQALRLKRAVIVAGADRTIHHVLYPITDIPATVDEALRLGADLAKAPPRTGPRLTR
ncbi:redoxin domain-containing protein [Nonomuraea phyllanthi]|uniref:winged helix-turn-helix transcriptional regulator n=1 Tax=Nonomuraea phyllanthi TaxID=2219224 RepID=UPI001292CE87|nr:winged helix-turn-helix transcriptional regulator [Nonomuraea phyllanthi]QFY13433.1 redoxin domain-containing protein [Nonomuraea phyllanthi]